MMRLPKWLSESGFFRIRPLVDGLESGNDNFLLLRLIAASLVIYGHRMISTYASGAPDVFAWMDQGDAGGIAVQVFFVASGFMIAGSYLRRRHLFDFLWARLLRIVPAYVLCLFGCAYVLGALYTDLPLAAYWHQHGVAHYVSRNVQFSHGMIWTLPGVFTHNPKTDVVNGSIWTLPAEVRMYAWVALLGVTGTLARQRWCNIVLAALFVWGLLMPMRLLWVPIDAYRPLAGYFALGVFCYVNRHYVPTGWPIAVLAAWLAWAVHATPLYPFVFGLALTAFVFAFAYDTPWHGFNRMGDYSYGLYLWGFPVQQAVAFHFSHAAPLLNAALAWVGAMVLAVLSWYLVERPCLKLKSLPHVLLAWVRARRGLRTPT